MLFRCRIFKEVEFMCKSGKLKGNTIKECGDLRNFLFFLRSGTRVLRAASVPDLITAFCSTQWGGRCRAVLFFLSSLNNCCISSLALCSLSGSEAHHSDPSWTCQFRRSAGVVHEVGEILPKTFCLKYFHILHLSAAPAHPLGKGLGCWVLSLENTVSQITPWLSLDLVMIQWDLVISL